MAVMPSSHLEPEVAHRGDSTVLSDIYKTSTGVEISVSVLLVSRICPPLHKKVESELAPYGLPKGFPNA